MERSFHSTGGWKPLQKQSHMHSNQCPRVALQTVFKSRSNHQIILKQSHKNADKQIQLESDILRNPTEVPLSHQKQERDKKTLKTINNGSMESVSSSPNFLRQSRFFTNASTLSEPLQQNKSTSHSTAIQKPIDFDANLNLQTLQDLQRKTQEVLDAKLLNKSKSKKVGNFKFCDDDIEKELKKIIEDIRLYQSLSDADNRNIDLEIKQISQKIGMIERILAESFTESEMLKTYYFSEKLNRKKVESNLISSLSKTISGQNFNFLYQSQEPMKASLYLETTNNLSYIKPETESYQKSSRITHNYLPNRQPIGKSSYETSFLNYGALPVYPSIHKNFTHTFCSSEKEKKQSSYKDEFKAKKIKMLDLSDLDCRKDKIKFTSISFMPKHKTKQNHLLFQNQNLNFPKPSNKDLASSLHRYESYHKQLNDLRRSSVEPRRTLETNYSRNFKGQNQFLDCNIKQLGLNNLKYEFRKKMKI